jgi:hypothetical protein
VLTDSASSAACIAKRKSRKGTNSRILQRLFECAVDNDACIVRADHYPGKKNIITDWASRKGADAAANLVRLADPNALVFAHEIQVEDPRRTWLSGLAAEAGNEKQGGRCNCRTNAK